MLLKEFEAGAGMLAPEQLQTLRALAAELSPLQAAWLSGYLAAVANQGTAPAPIAQAGAEPSTQSALTILYGSQTGNVRSVAEQVAERARGQGNVVNLVSMADYKPKQIKDETRLLVVVSTQGEGDPPDDAITLHKFLFSKRAPKLDGVDYAVLALGDSSYEYFCQTGKEFDEKLAELGGNRLAPRVDCDVDYEAAAEQWQQQILELVKPTADVVPISASASVTPATQGASSVYNRANPFSASLIVSQKLTGRGSSKDVRHVELDLADSGLTYQPGDSLGVWMDNDPGLVGSLLQTLELDGDTSVEEGDLRSALTSQYELTLLHPPLVKGWAELANHAELNDIVGDDAALRSFLKENQLIDLVSRYPAKVDAQTLLALLRKLTPRLYSIASSQSEVDEEVHLTVGLVADDHHGVERLGAVSGAFARRLEEGDEVRIYVEENDKFRLPADDAPIIMIGPGTGIAPFRAFMQEREAQGAEGDNWLFFGNPTFTEDFLYQLEWQGYVKSGLLGKISLAFSRDQQEKIYVQDRIREQGAEVYQWLERGAHLYVCGDANRMAKDVEQALIDVIAEYGGKSVDDAEEFLDELRSGKRYQKDVY